MRAYFLFIIVVVVGVLAMYLYPIVRVMLGLVDTTGWVPLMKAWLAFTPWFLLIVAGWYIFNKATGR